MAIGKLCVASIAVLAFSMAAYAQPASEGSPTAKPEPQQTAPCPMYGEGMRGGMGMRGDMHGRMSGEMGMHGGQGMRGMMGMHFPPGYEKLEMQMHAEMMESMAKIMKKYAAQLPDKR